MEITIIIIDREKFSILDCWDWLGEVSLMLPDSYLASEYEHINDCLVVDPDPSKAWDKMLKAAIMDNNHYAVNEIQMFIHALNIAGGEFEDLRERGYNLDPTTGGWN